MSSTKEREERAFEALIVSQLRKECDPDKVKLEDLPALTDQEKAVLKALGPDLVERLWDKGKKTSSPASVPCRPIPKGELVMNRADEVSVETANELARRKAELIERMKRLDEEKKNG